MLATCLASHVLDMAWSYGRHACPNTTTYSQNFNRMSAWLVSLYTHIVWCYDVLVARYILRIHRHDHACSLGVHARQQCRCLHELWLQSIIACFESATILISTIACYRLHASCMLLRPCPVWHRVVISLPDLPGYCGRRSF